MLSTDYREVMNHIRSRIVGQDRALEQVEEAVMLAQANITDPYKPLCTLFFAGPTGVGKSEVVVALAEAIHDDGEKVCRVDCNLLKREHYAAALTGSPPGYVGSHEGNTLLNKNLIEGEPGKPGILVLEEIEKAHPVVWDTLMGIFDKAHLELSNGKETIDFANTFIILTSNIGSQELKEKAEDRKFGFAEPDRKKEEKILKQEFNLDGDARRRIVRHAMDEAFRPEWIARIDYTVVFRWLTPSELMEICDRLIEEVNSRLIGRQVFLEVTYPAKELLINKGFDLKYGARPLKHVIRREIEVPIAKDIVTSYKAGRKYIARRSKDKIFFDHGEVPILEPPKEQAPVDRRRDKETVQRRVQISRPNGVIKEVAFYLYPKEAEVWDRWSALIKGSKVSALFACFKPEDFVEFTRLFGHLEERMVHAEYEPDMKSFSDFVAWSVFFVKGVWDSGVYWAMVNTHLDS